MVFSTQEITSLQRAGLPPIIEYELVDETGHTLAQLRTPSDLTAPPRTNGRFVVHQMIRAPESGRLLGVCLRARSVSWLERQSFAQFYASMSIEQIWRYVHACMPWADASMMNQCLCLCRATVH